LMGAKKKVEVQQPPPPPPEKATNVILKITTQDGTEFKLSEDLFSRYSSRIRSLAEASKDGSLHFADIDRDTFQLIVEFLELHREKEPLKIAVPIRTNQSLSHIMEESDADLIDKVVARGDEALLRALDATLKLEMETLRRRLACGVAVKLMCFTVEELREEYDLGEQNFEEEGLRNAVKAQIEELKKSSME
jgi:hypothetical protein